MEACGSGGRSLLFQTGPGLATPLLIEAYASSVPFPYATVLGQEIFQSGIIPSDSDFRIFRDHGGLPGLDFAFYENGYVYHTKFDTADIIPDGSIEQAGVNILALVRKLVSIDLKSIPPVQLLANHSGEKLVFFDIASLVCLLFTVNLSIIF